MSRHTNFAVIPSAEKLSKSILPYLTFPLTKGCIFRCVYCGHGGETTASHRAMPTYDFVVDHARAAYDYGIRKFRLTGGEPTLHPRFGDFLAFFSRWEDVFLLVNTNAALIGERRSLLENASTNIQFAASLDSLERDNFNRISGTDGYFDAVLRGIRVLADRGNLFRLNMVVNQWNAHELFPIIDFCQELMCNLKLLDVVSVPVPYSSRETLHVCTDAMEDELAQRADSVELHQYARSFGTPCNIYTIGTVRITVKSTSHGSHYDLQGICKECPYFPCHEGLYDLFLLPDGRLCGCRWSATSVSPGQTFLESLDNLVHVFQRSEWYQSKVVMPMAPFPSFVQHTVEYSFMG